jgi:phosphonate metabolism protein (transferase hexapeptide repeat family)
MIMPIVSYINATGPEKKLGKAPFVDPSAKVIACELGAYTEVGARAQLLECSLGDYSYVVNDSDIAYSDIGKFTSIASHVRINPGDHPMHRASQSHFTYRASAYFDAASDEPDFFEWRRGRRVEIGHDVWIGHGSTILSRRKIGTGAVVGAGSVVTKDVPPYAIVAGNPAQLIRMRVPEDVVAGLLELQWWYWSHERLQAALPDFRELAAQEFLERYTR